uniref:Repressor protein CI n=1 Tax=Siphoviridae sp. ctDmR33 TaxID=2825389 RepID=A0A8S5UXB2_9CAUD|nr:MAG TPA: Repressor protein CI [Siphoviridae sp. ctDmR33]
MNRKFSDRLILLRQEKDLTQVQVANGTGLTENSIQNYERGRRKPTYDALITLADYFDVSLDYLVGRSTNPRRLP